MKSDRVVIPSFAETPDLQRPVDQVLWLLSDDPIGSISAARLAEWSNRRMRQPHMIWDPSAGEMVEMVSPSKASHISPYENVARMYSVMVIATEWSDWVSIGGVHLPPLLEYLEEDLKVPPVWPLGPPSGYPVMSALQVERAVALPPGHYSIDQLEVPGGYRPVGRIDTAKLRRSM